MMINLRGTSGSGKSTIVRKIMDLYPTRQAGFLSGRKQPFSYICHRAGNGPPLLVMGHYETPCGGCDTLSMPGALDIIYRDVLAAHRAGMDVMYEGIIVQDDVKRAIKLHQETRVPIEGEPWRYVPQLLVIGLTTPIEECIAGIQSRRDGRGDVRPLNTTNTVNRAKRVKGRMAALRDAGVDARFLSREDALALCIEGLEL